MKKNLTILTGIFLIVPIFAVLTVFFTVALLASIIQFIIPRTKALNRLIKFIECLENKMKFLFEKIEKYERNN